MYSSCVRAVAALAVHVAAVIMTELLVLRLVVTEAGRNPELAHLEHSFQHQYVPRNTTEVNVTPPMKQQRKESTWKQNQRSIRHPKSEVDEVVACSCSCKSGTRECGTLTLPHRIELRTHVNRIWLESGESGIRAYLERYIGVVEPNMKTMAKHGVCCAKMNNKYFRANHFY